MQPSILLIGSGRLAKHLKHWHSLLNTTSRLSVWSRRLESTETLKELLKTHSHLWLAISDSSLSDFYATALSEYKGQIVHFSGAFQHPAMVSAHPLMSFSHELYDLQTYQKIHFALTDIEKIETALPGFTNSFTALKPEDKALYHALCVMSGNLPQLLWSQTFKIFKTLGIPDTAVDRYILQITQNFVNLKQESVTGPLVRRDHITINKNITSLEPYPDLQKIYQTFAKESQS